VQDQSKGECIFSAARKIARMRSVRIHRLILLAIPITFATGANAQVWKLQISGANTSLRGISVVRATAASDSPPIVWATGSNGVIYRSKEGGDSWQQLSKIASGEKLDIRGVRAFDAKTAYVMSSGSGNASRIYKTTDGGTVWELHFVDERPAVFLDDIVCFTETQCFALGDPVDGKFFMIATDDGKHWREIPRDNMPPILQGEGAFAASGTSLIAYGRSDLYFVTGGAASARVFHSLDLGRTWAVTNTPIAAGNASSGIFSIARSGDTLVVVGGDYRVPAGTAAVAAYSKDAGKTWTLSTTQPGGYRSAVAFIDATTVVCAGTNGEDISHDSGVTWTHTDAMNLNAIGVLDSRNAWAVGAHGTFARYVSEKSH
jgi:photosystem II stability/assembly factor-like uncharacterized protein